MVRSLLSRRGDSTPARVPGKGAVGWSFSVLFSSLWFQSLLHPLTGRRLRAPPFNIAPRFPAPPRRLPGRREGKSEVGDLPARPPSDRHANKPHKFPTRLKRKLGPLWKRGGGKGLRSPEGWLWESRGKGQKREVSSEPEHPDLSFLLFVRTYPGRERGANLKSGRVWRAAQTSYRFNYGGNLSN